MQYFLIFLQYLLPAILILVPFLMFYDINPQQTKHQQPIPQKPNIDHLEEKLNNLIQNNRLIVRTSALSHNLQNTKSNIIASYLNKNYLNGFHLFQLIFSLLKNQIPDKKIIKILHHYLPSCSVNHLQTLLFSYKNFLNLIQKDNCQKALLRDLNQNKLHSTLCYLEKKLTTTLNNINTISANSNSALAEEAALYGLIFASFAEFYDKPTTAQVLELCYTISPHFFRSWHTFPKKYLPYDNSIRTETALKLDKTPQNTSERGCNSRLI